MNKRVLPPLLAAVLGLCSWQLLTVVTDIPESTLPSPLEIVDALIAQRSVLLDAALTTLAEIALGLLLAITLAVMLAVVLTLSPLLERATYPWLVVSQLIPLPALAPILVLWTGFDLRPKVLLIALVSFFPLTVNTIDGLRTLESEIRDTLLSLGANRWQLFRRASFPHALPYFFSGLRISVVLAVIGAVFAEWVGSSSGIGYLILTYSNQNASPELFAAVFLLAVIGLALFFLVSLLERISLPWRRRSPQLTL